MSLLQDFILRKSSSYVEPRREGTPKGSPIGLSKQKYLATLALLYDPKPKGMKKIARGLKVSYGVLRKWSTEEQFKKQVWQNHREFSEVFWDYISSTFDKRTGAFHDFLKQPLTQLANEKSPTFIHERDLEPVSDFSNYHGLLQERIVAQYGNIVESSIDLQLKTYAGSILELLLTRSGFPQEEFQERNKMQRNLVAKRILDCAIDCLTKPSISHDDRAASLVGLKMLRESFEDK